MFSEIAVSKYMYSYFWHENPSGDIDQPGPEGPKLITVRPADVINLSLNLSDFPSSSFFLNPRRTAGETIFPQSLRNVLTFRNKVR